MIHGLGSPLKWHGGKHYLAQRIVALMPPHLHYVEPYFGGGSVLLAKDPEGVSEVVNDIDAWLMKFWEVMQRPEYFEQFRRRMAATPFSEHEFNFAKTHMDDCCDARWNDPVTAASWFFICCRQSLAGRMDSFAPLSKTRTRRGMNEQASAWLSAVEGLPEVHARLQRVVILDARPALEVIEQQDGKDTLFYLDPPYLDETRASPNIYAHEMTRDEHNRLLKALEILKGKFLLSGYRNELYDLFSRELGWKRQDFDLPNNAAAGGSKRRMTECVWSNF